MEKLIVYLPVLLAFFATWELAELGAASLVVQRASAAAGRAAMVVLPDDPSFYGGEPTDTYDGARRGDVELAAGMVLSSNPHLTSEFEVDVSDPPAGSGSIEVTLTAEYRCGSVGLLCGLDGLLALSSTTTHAYHGARYEFASPGPALDGGSAALMRRKTSIGSTSQAVTKGKTGGGNTSGDGSCPVTPPDRCNMENGIEKHPDYPSGFHGKQRPNANAHTGTQKTGSYGSDEMSMEAIQWRCDHDKLSADNNVAVIKYKCADESTGFVHASSGNALHSEKNVWNDFKANHPDCEVVEFYTEREPCSDRCVGLIDRLAKTNPGLKDKVSWHFDYNPIYNDFDPTISEGSGKYYDAHRKACTKINKQFPSKGYGYISCRTLQKWANDNNKINDNDVKLCMEYHQARQDFKDDGPRRKYEEENKKAMEQVLKKKCHKAPGEESGGPSKK